MEVEHMKKVFMVLLMIVIASGVCFAMAGGAPQQGASNIPANAVMKIVTGEVISWAPVVSRGRALVRVDVLDNNRDKTTVDLQLHTTKDWGKLEKNMMVEIPYFVSEDGRNIAYWVTVEGTAESTASMEAK
jgi:hypothetical protein